MPELAAEALTHVYAGGVRALDGMELRISPGERVAIIGQNGSGKSTLIRHLNGLLRPTEGRILVDGRDARSMRVAELAALVGLVFQDADRQIFARTVADEVSFGPRNLGMPASDVRDAVRRALEATGLGRDEARNPYDLGQARRKLLALASVLAMRTPVLVMDEPTTGQDASGVARVRSIVERTAAEGRTVIAVTHDMELVAGAFERVIVMRAGRVVADGSPATVFARSHRDVLRSTNLEAPLAARVAAALEIPDAVTPPQVVAALRDRPQ